MGQSGLQLRHEEVQLTAFDLLAEFNAAVTLFWGELVCRTLWPAISEATLPSALASQLGFLIRSDRIH